MRSNRLCKALLMSTALLFPAATFAGEGGEKIVHVFRGTPTQNPATMLVEDSRHNLYGTTFYDTIHWAGSVFELSPRTGGGWSYHVLHVFTEAEGCYPLGKLLIDASGTLYGTTYDGGADGCGTVYRLKPSASGKWVQDTLHQFNNTDGCFSLGGLAMDRRGNLYGGTFAGGSRKSGVAFQLTRSSNDQWTYRVLHEFRTAEASPSTGFISDAAGNIYGGDQTGIFALSQTKGRWAEHVAYSFQKKTDGYLPEGDLFFDAHGNLYGTNHSGGRHNRGTVFELSPTSNGGWSSTVLHSFGRGSHDGTYPTGGVVVGPTGEVYGTTSTGGSHGDGTVFRLMQSTNGWTEKVLHDFSGGRDGANPSSGVLLDKSGLYGTAFYGGTDGVGTLFEIMP